ncbi:MAG: hypothetical protein ACK6CT_10855 [Planctomycetia bacterium]|jgi:hypothetical protein
MPDLLPPAAARSAWFTAVDRFVFDIHRSGFVYSLLVHIAVLLVLATFCLGTDPEARRPACVVAFEGSGAEAFDGLQLDLGAATAAAEPATVAIEPRIDDVVVPLLLAAELADDGWHEETGEIAVEPGGVLAAEVGSGAGFGRGTGDAAGAGAATFFGAKAAGDEFVFIVDFSGSMAGPRIDQARYELRKSIESLAVEASFFIFLFNDVGLAMPAGGLVRATPDNKDYYLDWVDRQPVGGGTNPVDALAGAMRLKPDAIFLLTDGVFNDPAAVVRIVPRAKGPKVHAVAFHDNAGEEVLRRIAQKGRGTYRFQPP